jgi:23S rRNA (cytidine1920-2'-O)/16S rRNA (cytidine1409-2'-O)-methyltransferase
VDDRPVTKAGTPVSVSANVAIKAEQPKYVCRAGLKLEAALQHFHVDPTARRALDAGLSTGGFTDCLLQHGAAEVIGVDVGYGQVAERVRTDPRVIVMERTNFRHLRRSDLPGARFVDLVTLDLSFISGENLLAQNKT